MDCTAPAQNVLSQDSSVCENSECKRIGQQLRAPDSPGHYLRPTPGRISRLPGRRNLSPAPRAHCPPAPRLLHQSARLLYAPQRTGDRLHDVLLFGRVPCFVSYAD
uniref:Uncharacterized protein n=1 Tax=Cacopsylla melanoneura TaxID=428564 RepID=A0A8D8QLK3_9HEMI